MAQIKNQMTRKKQTATKKIENLLHPRNKPYRAH